MKVKDLIKLLAKANWEAEVYLDPKPEEIPNKICDKSHIKKIKSTSEFISRPSGKPILTLNIRNC
jgi:hypothetical protein